MMGCYKRQLAKQIALHAVGSSNIVQLAIAALADALSENALSCLSGACAQSQELQGGLLTRACGPFVVLEAPEQAVAVPQVHGCP